MGSGKTSVARALGQKLNCRTVDLDQAITEEEERTPSEIIEQDGENTFREVETNVLQQLLEDDSARVLALGGGAWARQRNRDLIAERKAFTVWLDAPFELCWQRIAVAGSERPLARDRESAQHLYNARRAAYALTKLHLEVSREKSVGELAEEIRQNFLTPQ